MIFTIEKLVLFAFKDEMKHLLVVIFGLICSFGYAQEKDKDLIKSNDYVYEGNVVVDDNFIEAEKEYRKAISKKPTNVNGAYNLGNAYYNTGNYSEALMLSVAKGGSESEPIIFLLRSSTKEVKSEFQLKYPLNFSKREF